MCYCIREWDILTGGDPVPEVGGSNPGRGIIVGGVFSSNQASGKMFSPE